MNSFAALIGVLTGVPATGAAGAGLSASSQTGLFARLLEAGDATQPGANGGTGGKATQTLQAALLAGSGASDLGMIKVTGQIDALVELDGVAPLPATEALPEELAAELAVAAEVAIDGEAETPLEGAANNAGAADDNTGAADEKKADTGSNPASAVAADANMAIDATVGAPFTDNADASVPAADSGQNASRSDTAPVQGHAPAGPAANTRIDAGASTGLARQPAAAHPSPQHTGGAPAPANPNPGTGEQHRVAAAPGKGGGDKNTGIAVKPAEDSGKAGNRKRVGLAKPAELIRAIAGPTGTQTQLRVVRSGDSDVKAVAGIDQSTTTVQLRAAPALPQPAAQPPQLPVNALAVHIAQQAGNGARRFDIRLDPPELGRIDVRLDVSRDGHVTTHLVVERSETLDLLQRDARTLERALQNAGLNTADGGMKFSLKDHGQGQGHAMFRQNEHSSPGAHADGAPGEASFDTDNIVSTERRYIATGGLDIRI